MILEINFEDFKKFVEENNKRIYYFQEGFKLDLYFLSEGIITKSKINIEFIENKEVFFGDVIFKGATKLIFNLPVDNKDTSVVRSIIDVGPDIILLNDNEERKNVNIQKEGVDE